MTINYYPHWYVCTTRVYVLLCCSCCCCCGDISQEQPKSSAEAVYITRLDHQSSNLQFAICNLQYYDQFRPISTGSLHYAAICNFHISTNIDRITQHCHAIQTRARHVTAHKIYLGRFHLTFMSFC
jgi:hypothetical protein